MIARVNNPRQRRASLGVLSRLGMLAWLVLAAAFSTVAIPVARAQAPSFDPKDWQIRFDFTSGELDRYDIFGRDDLPPFTFDERGRGVSLTFGRRFGRGFVLGFRLGYRDHDTGVESTTYAVVETEVTGTFEFNTVSRFRPFLVVGLGGMGALADEGPAISWVLGPSASVGGGARLYFNRWLSLEFEAAFLAWNRRLAGRRPDEGTSIPDMEWDLRGESYGWRSDLGLAVWF